MSFEAALKRYIELHKANSEGERKRRLEEGLGHAEVMFLEKVWWPAFGSFDDLHPEYEVHDMAGRSRFLDYAYTPGHLRAGIDIEGFGPHLRNADRWKFSDDLRRYNQLVVDGWLPLRFSYDDVVDHPRRCEQTIRTLLGRWLGTGVHEVLTLKEREVLQCAVKHGHAFTPGDIASSLDVGNRYVRTLLHSLTAKGLVTPASGEQRIRTYHLNRKRPIIF